MFSERAEHTSHTDGRLKVTECMETAAPVGLWDVALPTVGGGTLRLADLRGKQVLLFCWASW